MEKLDKILFKPVSPVTLGVFRIGFGVIMLFQFYHIQDYFFNYLMASKYFIKYDFFEWVPTASIEQLRLVFNLAIVSTFLFTIGLFTRFFSFVVFILWTYLFLMDQGHNNNHYYLIGMFLFFMSFVQSDQWGSVRNFFKPSKLIPQWNYLVFKGLIFILYFYGAIAKINMDWLRGYPLRYWLHGRTSFGETIQTFLEYEYTALFFSYYGLIFDLVVGFALFHKKYRFYILPFLIPFHISNHFLWPIGVFPWLSIFVTILFFEDKVDKLFKYNVSGHEVFRQKNKKVIKWFLVTFFVVQILFPLRGFLYGGRVNWHGYGEFFSWHMMLADKQGAVRIRIHDQNDVYLGEVAIEQYVNDRQLYKLVYIPKTFVPFCKYIEKEILSDKRNKTITDVKIYVDAFKTINNRPFARVIDPTVDLTAVEYSVFKKGEYILPFKNTPIEKGYNVLTFEEMLQFTK